MGPAVRQRGDTTCLPLVEVITDHFIRRKVPRRDLQAELQERHLTDAEEYHGEVVSYYPSSLPKTSENSRYLAVAQVAQQNNLIEVADLAREMNQHPPREEEFYIALGDAWKNSGNSEAAVGAFEQAVRIKPKSVTALRSFAASLKASGNVSRSEQILNRALHWNLSTVAPGINTRCLRPTLGEQVAQSRNFRKRLR